MKNIIKSDDVFLMHYRYHFDQYHQSLHQPVSYTHLIGGGISKQPLLQEYIHKHIDRMYNYYQSHDYPLNKPKVVICQYGNDANLLGALFQLKNSMK